jgi:cytochrome P450
MYSAGFGTTVRMLSNGLVLLMQHPDQADALRADPSLARQTTEEVLRYDGPVMDVGYIAGDDAQVEDTPIEPGTHTTIIIGAANYDPRLFDDPGVFDVTRKRATVPLSFGYGIHYCLGVSLSRLEGDVVFPEIVRRFPRMQLAEEPERHLSFRSRAWKQVNAVLEPR